MGILIFFRILEEKLSAFQCWVCSLTMMRAFYHEWILSFAKCSVCICWDDNVSFTLPLVNAVYHIDWFADTEPSLHLWHKSHFMVYDPFYILNLICLLFFEDFCIYIHQIYWPVLFFFKKILSSFGFSIRVIFSSPSIFWNSLRRLRVLSLCWAEFSWEAVWSQIFFFWGF